MTGKFITLEGGEGVGKSTQLSALAAALSALGLSVVTTREPGGSAGAEAIRALLMQGSEDRWSARSEALLFAAARADHVEKTIRPAIARGDWVLCDRFVDSSRAYQGGAGGLSDGDILALHRVGSEGLMPDRTLVLTLPPAESVARAAQRDRGNADRMGSKDKTYYQKVAQAFERFSEIDSERIRLIPASGSADEVTARLIAALEYLL
ncbi:MAG: dTMP kinase [Pseudomonadota bacterium]